MSHHFRARRPADRKRAGAAPGASPAAPAPRPEGTPPAPAPAVRSPGPAAFSLAGPTLQAQPAGATPAVQRQPKDKTPTEPAPAPTKPQLPEQTPNYVDTLAERVDLNVFTGYYGVYWGKEPSETAVYVRADESELYEGNAIPMPLVQVSPDRATALQVVAKYKELEQHGYFVYTYYQGPGGCIEPTLFSPQTTPRIYATMVQAAAVRRKQAKETAEALKPIAIGIGVGIVLRPILGPLLRVSPDEPEVTTKLPPGEGGGGKPPTKLPPGEDVGGGGKPPVKTGTGGEGEGAQVKPPAKPPAAAQEPAKVPPQEPAKPPAQEPGKPPAQEPAKPPAQEPAKPPAQEPAKPPAQEPAKPPAQEPAKPPTQEPAKAPAQEPAKEPAKATPKEPAKAPPEKPAAKPYVPCFLAGTEVEVGGRATPIEVVALGDLVLGAPENDAWPPARHPVTGLHRGRARTVLRVDVAGGSLFTTRAHRFHVPGRGWVPAAELRAGDPLTDAGSEPLRIAAVERLTLVEEAPTFDLTVGEVSTYFVRAGAYWVLVHNGGPSDFGGPLYWIFGKKPKLRPDDVDGLSVWKTNSKAEVNTLMDHRVNVVGRSTSDPHICLTEGEVQAAGLVVPPTPSKDPLAAKLEHHSLRPADAPPYPKELTGEQMTELTQDLGKLPNTIIKPTQAPC